MKSSQKGFVIPVVIAIIALLVIGGGAYIYTNTKVEAPANIPEIVSNVPTSTFTSKNTKEESIREDLRDWKTYSNQEYGLTFKYPNNFEIVEDGIYQKYFNHPKGFNWYRLKLEDKKSDQNPFILIEINPDGWGPQFVSKEYIVIGEGDRLKIMSTEDKARDMTNEINKGKAWLRIGNFLAKSGASFSFHLNYDLGSRDYETVFEKIIDSVFFDKAIVNTENPVACTMDAKQCPDGSWVGRTGPKCEFVCPVL